ncbi:MAG: LysR family transcriptional regulator [Saccharospirillum sp.]
MLDRMNLRHLHYFWVIGREGSIVRASEVLDLAPQTLSGQLSAFESALGVTLFRREKRSLVLTETGQWVFAYAEQIFALTQELSDGLAQPDNNRPIRLSVGVVASIHKLIAYRLIEPAMNLSTPVHLRCHTGIIDDLLRGLKRQAYDVVLTDQLPPSLVESHLHSHALLSSSISLFGSPEKVAALKTGFPGSLEGEAFLANSLNAPYLVRLLQWFNQQGIKLRVMAEIDDSALIKVFGSEGKGLFAAPTVIRDEVCRQYRVDHLAAIESVTDELYAVTRTHDPSHQAVHAIISSKKPDETDR